MGLHEQAILSSVIQQYNCGTLTSCVQFSGEQIAEFYDLLSTAVDNDGKQTKFPDFVCSNGWIEHFAVTFGELTKDGRGYENFKLEKAACKKILCEAGEDALVRHVSTQLTYGSHENFMKTLKENWDNHIDHLQKSGGEYVGKTGVFLVEIDDRGIVWHIIDGNRMTRQLGYQMALDSEFLDFIYGYRNYVKYVITYILSFGVSEVLAVESVPEAKKLLPHGVSVRFDPVFGIQTNTLYRLKDGES